jgi:hypothetical protein
MADVLRARRIPLATPLNGWPPRAGRRALVIGSGLRGCVSSCHSIADCDMVLVPAD